ncbi:putative phytochrome-like histidine kinase [Xylaria flabelliformis]|nr:putative phytochrome-like histidine kinase [Xylaria flabelliformis]
MESGHDPAGTPPQQQPEPQQEQEQEQEQEQQQQEQQEPPLEQQQQPPPAHPPSEEEHHNQSNDPPANEVPFPPFDDPSPTSTIRGPDETPTDASSATPVQEQRVQPQPQQQQQQQQQQKNGEAGITAADRQRGFSSSTTSSNVEAGDRVFPIRSAISVDQSQPTPWVLSRDPSDVDYFPRTDATWDGRRRPSIPNVMTDASASASASQSSQPSPANDRVDRADRVPSGSRYSRKNTLASPTPSEYVGSPPPNSRWTPAVSTLPLFNDAASDDRTRGTSEADVASFTDEASSTAGERLNEGFMTTRFRHVMTDEGHAIITGRDGTLQRCEDEPIHTPGAVQGFGLLVALREEPDGRFSVRIVSENSKPIIGCSPSELFALGSFTDILSEEQTDNLLDHIDFIRDEESDPAVSGPDVFSISVRPPKSRPIKLWCAMHVNRSHPDLIICEFEPEDDQRYPIRPPDEINPEIPEDTLYQSPTSEQLHESTEVSSKPLRVLRSARKRRGEAGAMQVFDIMSQVQEQFASAPNLERFLKILVGIVKELTGFHRVMVYQFDAAYNGKVVTELVDPSQTRDLYHGLHFPASDIPKQARDLYKLNKVRLLYDRDLDSARLVCRTMEDLEQPLDLSHSYLRAMSPIHIKYLANMAVRSSMSISINAFGELWGLISCHSYGSKGMRVSFPIRKMCRMVGDNASRNIERLSYASRLQARKLINTMPTDKNPSGYIIASSDDLLKLFDADFGMLSIGDETKVLGKIAQSQEALALLEYLRLRNFTAVLTTQDVGQDFPDLRYTPGFTVIAGLLYVPLSVGGHDFIVFFRKGQVREVKWAGNPYEKTIKAGTAGFLEPRESFKAWRETVIGKCREWSEEQVDTAAVLCLVYGKFIEVWRQKEAALQSSRLTRLLLANSAHEVRTPLNAIINYLEIALEGSLDQDTRENLAKSHSASKSLIYVINDLLDLTKTEEGRELVKYEIMDLPACILEATEPFKVDAKRKGLSYEVIQHPGLPKYVHGDYRRVRQAIANVTANAMQNTSTGSVKVESFVIEVLESRVQIEISVQDTGCGMSNEQLDNLFQDLEQVSSADTTGSESLDAPLEQPSENRTLGLGLAVVARIMRNMDGQLRVKSGEGKGSRFVIQFPFELPSSDALEKLGDSDASLNASSDTATLASVTKALPPTQAGEVLLVDRGSANSVHLSNRPIAESRRSFDGTNSVSSLTSGGSGGARSNKSDADRLIDAIQTPLALSEADEEATHIRRVNSKGRRPHHPNLSASSLPSLDSPQHSIPTTSAGEEQPLLSRSITDIDKLPEEQRGVYPVAGSLTPIKPVKMPDEYLDKPAEPQTGQSSRVLFEVPETPVPEKSKTKASAPLDAKPSRLRVLVAEDDPVNMRIVTKRLEKSGHKVSPAVNGEDCAAVLKEKSDEFDIVLMDMQMPIVDGLTSTKLIREFEKSDNFPGLSEVGRLHGRIPIIAVSASLVERDRPVYTEAGFDGWILKPVDFKRLNVLLEGITNDEVRNQCLYQPGEWERGGWFARRALQPFEQKRGNKEASGQIASSEPPTNSETQ